MCRSTRRHCRLPLVFCLFDGVTSDPLNREPCVTFTQRTNEARGQRTPLAPAREDHGSAPSSLGRGRLFSPRSRPSFQRVVSLWNRQSEAVRNVSDAIKADYTLGNANGPVFRPHRISELAFRCIQNPTWPGIAAAITIRIMVRNLGRSHLTL